MFYRIHSPIKTKTPKTHSIEVSPSVAGLVKWTERKGYTFTPGSRHDFVKTLVGACHRLGISEGEVERELMRYVESDFSEKEITAIIHGMYAKVEPFSKFK
jgi:hypothetical protein